MIHDLAAANIHHVKVPSDWEQSFIVCLYKGKGDALEKGNYPGLKLTEQVMKDLERIVDSLIRRCQSTSPSLASSQAGPTGDQEVAGSNPAEVGNILSWRLIMKYFLRSFSPFRWFKKGSCQFLAKECAQYWLTA